MDTMIQAHMSYEACGSDLKAHIAWEHGVVNEQSRTRDTRDQDDNSARCCFVNRPDSTAVVFRIIRKLHDLDAGERIRTT